MTITIMTPGQVRPVFVQEKPLVVQGPPGNDSSRLAFASRADVVVWVEENIPEIGFTVPAGGVTWEYDGVSSTIPDMPGWRPFGDWSSDHFPFIKDGSDETPLIKSVIEYCGENGIPLDFTPGDYGFTNIDVVIASGCFNISAKMGGVRFVQTSARNEATRAVQIGGDVVGTTTLTTTAAKGTREITLTSATGVAAGHTVYLKTNRLWPGDHRFSSVNVYSQTGLITEVDGSDITLETPLRFDYAVGDISTGTAQSGAADTIVLDAGDTSTALEIVGYQIEITGGTGSGQTRYIHEYDEATKTVTLGTSYTGFPQDDWTTNPDATSTYRIFGAVTASVYDPADGEISGIEFVGYAETDVEVGGVRFTRWNKSKFHGMTFRDFSEYGLHTTKNYHSPVRRCHFINANGAEDDGTGHGYGHLDVASECTIVEDCTFMHCRTTGDISGGSNGLRRKNCTQIGGGLTYRGTPFFPEGTVENAGFSSHTGGSDVVDSGNTVSDIYHSKIRCPHTVRNTEILGAAGASCFLVSYTQNASVNYNRYFDGYSSAADEPSDGTAVIGKPATEQRPEKLVEVRLNTMPAMSQLDVIGNVATSLTDGLVNLRNTGSSTPNVAIRILRNTFSVASTSETRIYVLNGDTDTELRGFVCYDNEYDVSGADALGGVITDNKSPLEILGNLVTRKVPFQIGPAKYIMRLADDEAGEYPIGRGFSTMGLHIYERNGAVTNRFKGLLELGNTTPILTDINTDVNLATGVLDDGDGSNGVLTVSYRDSDKRGLISNRSGSAGWFIIDMDKAF